MSIFDSSIKRLYVECDECGEKHIAEYSHEGRFNEGAIFAVICTNDEQQLVDYYTSERLVDGPAPIDLQLTKREESTS